MKETLGELLAQLKARAERGRRVLEQLESMYVRTVALSEKEEEYVDDLKDSIERFANNARTDVPRLVAVVEYLLSPFGEHGRPDVRAHVAALLSGEGEK